MLAGAGDSRAARDGSCPSTAGVEGRKGLLETKDVCVCVYVCAIGWFHHLCIVYCSLPRCCVYSLILSVFRHFVCSFMRVCTDCFGAI